MFPFTAQIPISAHLDVHYQIVLDKIGPLLTEARRQKIKQVISGRNFSNAVVLESIYDRGNISAVMRSAEGMGFANIHVIETQEKFKESARVTQGADKWVEVQKWKSTTEAIKNLKAQGHRIIVTHLEAAKPLHEIDFSTPTALVLGNEKDGVSAEMIAAADERVIIPMSGFVQSFNISVAGALCFYQISQDLLRRKQQVGDLSEEQKKILEAYYYLRTQDSAEKYLVEMFQRGQV
ncbi:MAG: TrmH family RNA methyltransferase [Bdellovibrionia bacterium]